VKCAFEKLPYTPVVRAGSFRKNPLAQLPAFARKRETTMLIR
jgi:hypothetical protein